MSANCARCLVPRPATDTSRFCVQGIEYEIALCDKHTSMFDADMSAWRRCATDLGPLLRDKQSHEVVPFPVPLGGEVEGGQRVPFAEDVTEEIFVDALGWTFSEAARLKMARRGLTKGDVCTLIGTQDKTTRRDRNHPDAVVYVAPTFTATVYEGRKHVIDVSWRNESQFDLRELRASGQ